MTLWRAIAMTAVAWGVAFLATYLTVLTLGGFGR